MKVGTDGVLLGAWCRIPSPPPEAILEIGTGTGVIALQLAQRTELTGTLIDAVEIDSTACATARRNFEASEWSDRLTAYNLAIQDFVEANIEGGIRSIPARKYALIVSNPPWFVDSLASPHSARNMARHAVSLSYDTLISLCDRLLEPHGHISLIIPAGTETKKMIAAASAKKFVTVRLTEVYSTPKSGPKRTLIEFSRHSDELFAMPREVDTLTIQDGGVGSPGNFSARYRDLTRDFYLYF